jgi:hypothetical protein
MAAGYMPEGDELESRPCVVCREPIVAGQRFYQAAGWTILGHSWCVEDNIEAWELALAVRGAL